MPPMGSGSPVRSSGRPRVLGVPPVLARDHRELVGALDEVAGLGLPAARAHRLGGLVVEDSLALDGAPQVIWTRKSSWLAICSNMSIAIWMESRSPRIRWARLVT